MISIPILIRGCRRLFRAITTALDYLHLHYILYINQVKHGSIKSYGRPYICVAPTGRCVIGSHITMANGLRFNPIGYVQPCTIYVNAGATLTIGNNVGISQASIICHHSIQIGNHVKIGGGAKIYDTDFHSIDPEVRKDRKQDLQSKKCLPVVLGDNCFIGAGSMVLKGVSIGENAVVGAGSVVTKSVPANEIWAGNPAVFIRKV